LCTFGYHLDIMQQNEAGAFRGEDIEYIHDMRVAVRRMRTAYRIFKPYINADIQPYLKTLKKTGRILGMVRDMDVFRENYASYTEQHKVNIATSSVSKAWNVAYISTRNQLLDYLSSNRFLRFRLAFRSYLQNTATAPDDTPLVDTQLGNIILERQQKCVVQYQNITHLQRAPLSYYHQLRIYLKHFRYCIEYFRSVLLEAGEETIEETKVIQDHLGALQDAVVARNHLYAVLQWGSWFAPKQPYTLIPVIQRKGCGTAEYLAHIETTIQKLVTSFPGVWEQFTAFLSMNRLNLPLKNMGNTL
jgi:triphosphatase